MSKKSMSAIDNLIIKYNKVISKLINTAGRLLPNNPDIHRVRNIISLAKSADPLILLNDSKDKLWDAKDYIIERNEQEFFYNHEYIDKYPQTDDDKEFLFTILNAIKKKYEFLSKEEVKYIWDLINEMLGICVEYKIEIGDYDDCEEE